MHTKRAISCISWCLAAGMLLFWSGCAEQRPVHYPGEQWHHYQAPEEAGFDPGILRDVRSMAEELDTDAMMIVHEGRVVDTFGDVERNYRCHSIRKSFLTGMYGIQVDRGEIDLDATLADLDIDDHEALTGEELQATVRMLLQARSGVYHPALFETTSMAEARPERHSHEPGSNYYYNNWDFNAAGTIYEQETGEPIHESFEQRIARPVGMQDFTADDGRYVSGEDSRHDAYPFEMSTRDLTRFGLLYLRDGRWNGQQVLPESWADESTEAYSSFHTDPDNERMQDAGGYGYMWWVAVEGRHFGEDIEGVPEGTYTARGAGGHVLAVVPEHDLVVAHRVDTYESGNSVPYEEFGHMLMRIIEAREANALQEDETAQL